MLSCLSCNAQNATSGQLAALAGVMWAATWGAIQNRLPITRPTVAGPGILDDAGYLYDIASARGPNEANRAAAKKIYGLLLPGLGEKMGPMVDSLLDVGRK